MSKQGITFFTAIRNRKKHLQQTLPANLSVNRRADSCFLILDYGSNDGLADWLFDCFADELETEKLIYKRVEALQFDRCDSRNKASAFCETTLIVNIDADNYTGPDFDEWLTFQLSDNENKVITGLSNSVGTRDAFGKIALHKSLFDRVNGYDRSFEGYGFEDYDLFYRLVAIGAEMEILNDHQYLKAISHSDEERIAEHLPYRTLREVFFQEINAHQIVLLYLFNDSSFSYGIATQTDKNSGSENSNTKVKDYWSFTLASKEWKKGTWKTDSIKLVLQFQEFAAEFSWSNNHRQLTDASHTLVAVSDKKVITELIMFYMQIKNRYQLEANLENLMKTNTESAHFISQYQTQHSITI